MEIFNMEELTIKVTNINNQYHIRLFKNNNIIDEKTCKYKYEIGDCCKYMLRWYDKMGGNSKMATASRNRSFCKGEK